MRLRRRCAARPPVACGRHAGLPRLPRSSVALSSLPGAPRFRFARPRPPQALLSRFDILWLLLDESSKENDTRLANHIVRLHVLGRCEPDTHARVPGGTYTRAWCGRGCPMRLRP
jgi:hypothetical protein